MEGRSRSSQARPVGLTFCIQIFDFGRNNFGVVLAAIVSAVAVMQVAIDPDKPAFGAFFDHFLASSRKAATECHSG